MSLFFLFLKLLVVVVFLVMFLRRPSVGWGVGLLTVTTAVLLDTFLNIFNRELMLVEMGFFYYVLIGAMMAGAVVWLYMVLRPYLPVALAAPATAATETAVGSRPLITIPNPNHTPPTFAPGIDEHGTAFDRQMIYEEIRDRLDREDILDLMFDLGLKENEVMPVNQETPQLIINIMDHTENKGQTGALALTVERILTPPTPETLPRLEKITAESLPTILRHYLLAYTDLEKLQKMAIALSIDWEQIGSGSKKTRVRELLLYLYRRNRVDELISLMHEAASSE